MGLVIGWIAGSLLKPGPEALFSRAIELVPESAHILEAEATGAEFELLGSAGAPYAYAQFTSPLPPLELAAQLDEIARQRGWELLPAENWPNAIRRPLRSLLLEARLSTKLSDEGSKTNNDASINVRRHNLTGPIIVAASSPLAAGVGALIQQRRYRDEAARPIPLSLWVNACLIAAVWVAALSFVR